MGNAGGISVIDDFDLGYNEFAGARVERMGSMSATRVLPFSSDASFMIAKREGTHDHGAAMSFGGTALQPAEIAVLRAWILDGAQKN